MNNRRPKRRSDGQLRRLGAHNRRVVRFSLDGKALEALEGDTVFTAILMKRRYLRRFEFSDAKRSGFCLMGACQDCWVGKTDGSSVRACTAFIEDGMDLITGVALDES